MFDRKTRLLLVLGLLNDAYTETKSIIVFISDFIKSHPEMREIKEYELDKILNDAISLEKRIFDVMSELKREIEKTV
jgi:hypothetical protein